MVCSSPKVPKATEADKPAILVTARDGAGASTQAATGRRSMRIDLNNSTAPSAPYGSSLVIPS